MTDTDHVQMPSSMLSFDDRSYILAVYEALENGLELITTDTCPECDEKPAENDFPHYMIRGFVVIGCEGYHVINPKTLGVEPGNWEGIADVNE